MLAVTGYNSKITEALIGLLPEGEGVVRIAGDEPLPQADRYFLCAGLLRPTRMSRQDGFEVGEGFNVNFVRPIEICELVLNTDDAARICVMGSESAYTWSYDDVYAASKAALHRYVETKKLKPKQQLICVAPSIVEDAGMTTRRKDTKNLERRRRENPKQRFLKSIEVARMVHFLLYVDEGYTSGTVIRMNGGA